GFGAGMALRRPAGDPVFREEAVEPGTRQERDACTAQGLGHDPADGEHHQAGDQIREERDGPRERCMQGSHDCSQLHGLRHSDIVARIAQTLSFLPRKPPMALKRSATRNTTNRILAIPVAAEETPPKPKTPEMSARMRKISA